MKFLLPTAALLASASAHYTFPALIANGQTTSQWQYVRKTTNYQSNGPVTDVSSNQIRCYELSPGQGAPQTMTVQAGSSIGFTAQSSISHPGPLLFYMAKVPAGKTAATWDGSGNVWFKIYEDGPGFGSQGLTWPTQGTFSVFFLLFGFMLNFWGLSFKSGDVQSYRARGDVESSLQSLQSILKTSEPPF